jgi:hypothetical protein
MRATIRNPWAASLLLGALMAGLLVTPALAGARGNGPGVPQTDGVAARILASVVVRRPDGRIRLASSGVDGQVSTYTGPWLGSHIYNANGAGQAAIPTRGPGIAGEFFTFDVSIQNNGNRTDRFKVKATGAADGWTVTYSRGATNITRSVVAGTFETPSLAPGASYGFSARIPIVSGIQSNSVYRLVTIRSAADPTKLDAVKFGLRYCGC